MNSIQFLFFQYQLLRIIFMSSLICLFLIPWTDNIQSRMLPKPLEAHPSIAFHKVVSYETSKSQRRWLGVKQNIRCIWKYVFDVNCFISYSVYILTDFFWIFMPLKYTYLLSNPCWRTFQSPYMAGRIMLRFVMVFQNSAM